MSNKRALAQMLKHLSDSGVTHLPLVTAPTPVAAPARTQSGSGSSTPSSVRPTARRPVAPAAAASESDRLLLKEDALPSVPVRPTELASVQQLVSQSHSSAQEKTDALCALATTVAACRRCTALAETRTQTVFGVGNPDAKIMFIGEAPGADEDATGEPFVGKAGQLLNKIIEASTLRREEIYICNILRCRPPGNRNPLPQEAANCREFLDAQIAIVKPSYIVCWGTVAAQNLLGDDRAVGKLRGQFFNYKGAKVLCTYHPSYLLRNPPAKKFVWEDMKLFMAEFGVTLT